MTINLSSLPDPQVLEIPTLKAIRDSVLNTFVDFAPEYELLLASDPAIKVLDTYSFRDFLLRLRVDAAVKATLLKFATGANLDNVAGNILIERLDGESDEAFRSRVQLRGLYPSAAGPKNHYKYFALSASADVKDVEVDSPAPGEVRISVLGPVDDVNDGVPSTELLDLVDAAVQADDVRVLTDLVTTVPATKLTTDVVAEVRLLPDAPESVYTSLAETLRNAHTDFVGLGKDLTLSWIIDVLQNDDIHSITLSTPASDIVASANEFVYIDNITITQGARTK